MGKARNNVRRPPAPCIWTIKLLKVRKCAVHGHCPAEGPLDRYRPGRHWTRVQLIHMTEDKPRHLATSVTGLSPITETSLGTGILATEFSTGRVGL